MELIKLPIRDRNDVLVEEVVKLLDDARAGIINGLICIKFLPEGKFAIRKVGVLSDLEVCGALAFATHDVIVQNQPKGDLNAP